MFADNTVKSHHEKFHQIDSEHIVDGVTTIFSTLVEYREIWYTGYVKIPNTYTVCGVRLRTVGIDRLMRTLKGITQGIGGISWTETDKDYTVVGFYTHHLSMTRTHEEGHVYTTKSAREVIAVIDDMAKAVSHWLISQE